MASSSRLSVTVLFAAVMLVGCSGGGGDPLVPKVQASSSASAAASPEPSLPTETQTGTPAEAPPVLPPEATVADIYGGAAFIRHYFDLLNYAYRTGDVAPGGQIRKDTCTTCQELEDVISTEYTAGNSITGGVIGLTDVVVTPGDMVGLVEASIVVNQTEAQIIDPTGRLVDTIEPQPDLFVALYLEGTPDGWLLVEWGTP